MSRYDFYFSIQISGFCLYFVKIMFINRLHTHAHIYTHTHTHTYMYRIVLYFINLMLLLAVRRAQMLCSNRYSERQINNVPGTSGLANQTIVHGLIFKFLFLIVNIFWNIVRYTKSWGSSDVWYRNTKNTVLFSKQFRVRHVFKKPCLDWFFYSYDTYIVESVTGTAEHFTFRFFVNGGKTPSHLVGIYVKRTSSHDGRTSFKSIND